MSKILAFLILLFLTSAVAAVLAPGAAPQAPLLRDGFVLTGVDGTLIGPDGNDVWFFELASDVNDSSSVVKAGTRLELLPSSALEKMIADANMRSTTAYRLWDGRVTKYKGRNFIFPNYFQPLQEPARSAAEGTQDGGQKTEGGPRTSDLGKSELAVDEPNDVLAMPPEILERLRVRRERGTVGGSLKAAGFGDGESVKSHPQSSLEAATRSGPSMPSTDTIFVDRTAFLVKEENGRLVLTPDALGRNVQRLSLCLLPCEALELTEREQSAEPEPIRFKIAGIITKYKGSSYLLLQRATRTYSHGNFGR